MKQIVFSLNDPGGTQRQTSPRRFRTDKYPEQNAERIAAESTASVELAQKFRKQESIRFDKTMFWFH